MMVRRTRRRSGGSAIGLAILLAAGLSACNGPIEAIREAGGFNKNDPDPELSPYTVNLAKAESGAYPNLANVPPPPELASTVAERDKLAANLTGERKSVEASDAHGPGSPTAGPVPPPPPVPPSIAAPDMVAALPPPTPKPETPIPPMRKMDEPPPPAPVETTKETPQVSNVPGVEASRPAPGLGHPAAMPQPAPSTLAPAATLSGNPQPAPPQAVLPLPQVSPQVAALPPPKLPPTPTVVAAFDVSGTAPLAGDERARLAAVAAQYQAKPRPVRVVAYATPGVGSAEQLNAFRVALDRAQAVAQVLSTAGIPAKQIQAEAAPASATLPPGRVEVQLLQ
jgi:outer membrane protein OmpA-like peptidoglycan-associated protein